MQKRINPSLYLAVILFFLLIGMDHFFRMMPMLEEDIPMLDWRYFVRMLLIMLTSFLFVRVFIGGHNDQQKIRESRASLDKKDVIVFVLFISLSLLLQCVFSFDPELFTKCLLKTAPWRARRLFFGC